MDLMKQSTIYEIDDDIRELSKISKRLNANRLLHQPILRVLQGEISFLAWQKLKMGENPALRSDKTIDQQRYFFRYYPSKNLGLSSMDLGQNELGERAANDLV